jgi:hypothetical protein
MEFTKISNRMIWLFREQRSGSTYFTHALSAHLDRLHNFIDKGEDVDIKEIYNIFSDSNEHNKIIYSTHNFGFLSLIAQYSNNPIIFRTTRKDKTEQVISLYLAEFKLRKWHFSNEEEFYKLNVKPFKINFTEIDFYLDRFWKSYTIWEQLSSFFENYTIFYEDRENFECPYFTTKNWNFFDKEIYPRIPSPFSKKDLILNYDEANHYICNKWNNFICNFKL